MLNRKYELVATTKICEKHGHYTVYGIRHGSNSILDISVDKIKVECLVARMNAYGLSPLHMRDCVEDFIAEDSDFFSSYI